MPDEDWDSYERKHRSGKSRKRGKFERDSSAGRRLVDAEESRDYSSVAAGPQPFEKDLVDSAWERFDDTKGRGKRKGDRPENSWNDSGDIETATYEKNEMGKTSARKKQTRAAEPGETYEKDDKSKKLGIGRQCKTEREEWVDSRDIVDKGSDRAGVRARGDKPAPKAERGNSRDRIPLNLPDENWRDLEGSRKTSGDQKFGEKASFLLEAEDGVREETGGLHDDSVEDIAGDKTRREDFRRNIVGQSLSAEPNQARSKGRGASGNDYGSDRVVDRSTRWQRTDRASSPEWKEIGREKFRLGRAEKQGRIDSVDSERRWEEAEEAKLGSGSLGKEETDGKAGRWGRGKVENVREKQQEAWMEGDEPHSREAGSYLERRESRWDEPETVKRTWHGESEETMASMEFKRQRPRGRERLESVKGIFEDGSNPAAGGRDVRQLDRMEERHKRLKDAAESTKEDFEGWERFSERRRDGREDEDKLDRHRVGRDRGEIGWEVSEGRGRSISRMQDEEEESLIRSRPKDGHDFGWEELEDRRRSGGGRSGKSGRGVKRSWSPEGRRRGRVDHDEYDREWSDDMRDSERERGFRRDYDRDRESYRERERDAQRERDRDRDNFRNREMVREKDSDFLRDRDGARDREETDRWKSRQRDRQKERDDKNADGDYYDRDGWDVHKRDRDRPERSQRSGEEREWKEKAEALRSPQISGNINDSLERVGGMHVNALDLRGERGLASNSPFLPGRGEGGGSFGDFFKSNNDADWMGTGPEERFRPRDWFSGVGNDSRERYTVEEEGPPGLDQNFGPSMNRVVGDAGMTFNIHGGRGRGPKGSPGHRGRGGQLGVDGRPPFPNNQGSGMMMRGMQQGGKGGRGRGGGKGGRGGVRDAQRGGGIPPLLMGPGPVPGPGPGPGMAPHFGPLGPAVPMPGMGPNMGPGPAPGMGPAGFPLPPFGGPGGWAGGRGGGEMGMLPGPPGSAPVPTPGPAPRFVPNMGPSPGPNVFFSPPGPGRGAPSGMPGSAFGGASFGGRGMVVEKVPMGRVVPRISAPAGRAPSRGEQNDYSQHFVDTGLRPQNFIRDVDVSDRFEEYPKLKELITRKDKLIAEHACPPMYLQCDLRTSELSPELFGTKFDVILVDPPWEEYIRRAPGVGDSMEWWSYEDIQNLRIEAIADTPSFIFLWVGDAEGLDQGRLCLKKWGFRRCEDICWVKTNRENPTPALRHDASTLLQHSKEHCLMGIKGTVRRSTDGHVIHANIDTDIIISEEPPYGSTAKPEELYHIIEHFAQGQRRLELFGEDHNIRAGWVTAGKGLSSSNFNPQTYVKYFADSDGKVWQGGRGNPPADAPHLVGTTPEIEALRPKSPPPRAQQQQQSQAANSASQPSAVNLNTMKAPTASQGVATQSAQTAQNLAIQGSGQANPTSSVIVINSTSTIQGSGVGRNAGNVQITKPRRSPLRSTIKPAGPGSVVADGPEEEKSVGGDGQESIADKEALRHVEPPTEVVL